MLRRHVCQGVLGFCAILLVMTAAGTSRAGDGWGYGPASWYAWSNYGRMPYRTGNLPTPPYFAIFPPVYYDTQIVRRSYGDSPFAYGPDRPIYIQAASAPATVPSAPQLLANPYVESEAPEQMGRATKSRMIINPYYEGPAADVATR